MTFSAEAASAAPPYYDGGQVAKLLDYRGCIAAVREAMIDLSMSGRPQPLRQVVGLADDKQFGVMPGDLADTFGAKLVSVFGDSDQPGRSRHRGVIVAFAKDTGEVEYLADAETVTSIRTACATAAATDALALPEADVLAIFGTGLQAETHMRAIGLVRPLRRILLWGRSNTRAQALADRMTGELGLPVEVRADGREAAAEARIICTVSSATLPILLREWVRPGTHVNLVGSSYLGPVEVDSALVAASRYIADHRPSALVQAAELSVAREAGVIDDSHVVGEIGEVFAGAIQGRQSPDEITLYKSLGHVVQDLAAAGYLHLCARQLRRQKEHA